MLQPSLLWRETQLLSYEVAGPSNYPRPLSLAGDLGDQPCVYATSKVSSYNGEEQLWTALNPYSELLGTILQA